MATMATPAGQPLKKISTRRSSWLVITPSTPRFIFFQGLDLGVAMVAMVAMGVRSLIFPLEVQVADVSQAGRATAGRIAPSTRPCTPQPHRTALSQGHIRLAAHPCASPPETPLAALRSPGST